jgi:hypothetical protein
MSEIIFQQSVTTFTLRDLNLARVFKLYRRGSTSQLPFRVSKEPEYSIAGCIEKGE